MSEREFTLEEILSRIAKLQALADAAGTPEEAANAAAKVQVLLTRYNLTMARVNSQKDQGRPSDEYANYSFDIGVTTHWIAEWKRALLHRIAENNFCQAITITKTPLVSIVGEPHNIQMVAAMYKAIEPQVRRLCNLYWSSSDLANGYGKPSQSHERTWRRTFCEGCVKTIGRRLAAARRQVVQEEDCTALVEVKDALLEQATLKFHPNSYIPKARARTRPDDAYITGLQAGYSVKMREELK